MVHFLLGVFDFHLPRRTPVNALSMCVSSRPFRPSARVLLAVLLSLALVGMLSSVGSAATGDGSVGSANFPATQMDGLAAFAFGMIFCLGVLRPAIRKRKLISYYS